MTLALFDLDNTLVDRTAAFRRAAVALAEDHELDPDVAVPVIVDADSDGGATWDEWFAVVREHFALEPDVDELVRVHRRRYLRAYAVDAETVAALARLRGAGWRIGVVTNGPAFQQDKIAATGLTALIDGSAVSDLIGVRKPDHRIFAAAAASCGATLDGAWMVGDSPAADIAGAVDAGLTSVWVHRGRRWADVAFAPDRYALRIGESHPRPPPDFAPDHVVADVARAVALMLDEQV